jgi:hypothetical protein
MTTLGAERVYKKGRYAVSHHVSGDLSHSYSVYRPETSHDGWGEVGMTFSTLKNAKEWINHIIKDKLNWREAWQEYEAGGIGKSMRYKQHCGYVPISFIKKHPAILNEAYGEYAEKMRKRLKRVRV